MRKTFITQEYKDYTIIGTTSMVDKNLFIGKPINVPDIITLSNSAETNTLNTLYITKPEKVKGTTDFENLPTWEFVFNENDMLIAYIKKMMLLTGDWDNVDYKASGYNDIDSMLVEYIKNNILRLFTLSKMYFYTQYMPLTDAHFKDETNNSVLTNLLRDKPIRTYKAKLTGSEDVTLLMPAVNGTRKVQYKQTKSSRNYALLYYIVPSWSRI